MATLRLAAWNLDRVQALTSSLYSTSSPHSSPLIRCHLLLLKLSVMAEAAAIAFAKSSAIFVGKKVAETVISYVVNKALDRLPPENEDLKTKLKSKLSKTQAMLYGITLHEIQDNRGLVEWLWDFRDAIQEAEDALDELDFFELEKICNQKVESSSSVIPNFRRLRLSVSSSNSNSSRKNLKNALLRLVSVFDAAANFHVVMEHHLHTSSPRNEGRIQETTNRNETTRVLVTPVFGRQKEKDEIIEWLGVERPGIRDNKLSVCAIVGGGGMGKTTLAQFVCQDKKVQKHFSDMIIWVHVPKRFEPVALVRKMLESITRNKATTSALDTLQLDLSKELVTRSFLLVLDDAWEDGEIWGDFLAPLRKNASMGGRILLTTRMGSVADAVERQMPPDGYKCVKLGGLDHRDIVQILNHHASPNEDLELQIIAERIVHNLGGCPFVAKVIGQCLRDKTGHTNWNDFLNKKVCQLDDIAPRVMEMLRLSYEDLTPEVQICFQYCSIFPYHYKFRMEELTEMWMSSGLILQSTKGNNDQEKVARDHFNILLKKSFFSLIPRELHPDPSADYYVMHDMIYELSCLVSSEEFSRFKVTEYNTADVSERVRHLYIEGINSEAINVISKSMYLRTLIMANEEWPLKEGLADNFKKAIKCVTSLRLLRFDGNGWFDINDAISELKHLRYISMSATTKSNLNKLFKLFHLEVLKLLKIEGVEEASVSDICKLPNLQKLYLPKLALSRAPHIGRLTNLRELNGLSVRKEEGYKISELKDLKNLQKVFVFDVQNVSDCSEASSAELSNKKDMELLSLEWSNRHNRINERILDTLVPCKCIRHLRISGYKGFLPPLWIRREILTKLVHLKIVGCLKWDKLPSLASLSSLKHALLEDLPNLKCIGGPDGDGLPPFLVTLVVKECLQLLNLPHLPCSLKHLGIHKVGISCLPASNQMALQNFSTVDPQLCSIHVDSCPNLFSFGSCIIEEEHYKALASLKVVCCSMLKNLPNEEHFRRISTLESIEVLQCQNLSTLGGLGALSSLKILKIQNSTGLTATSSGIWVAPATRSSLVLDTLEIDDHLLLLENPFRNFCFTRSLIISDGSKMSELPQEWLLQNSSHLEHIKINNAILLSSLPSSMDTFHSLRSLVLCNAPVLQSLPAMPPNLWALHISGCSTRLKDGCKIHGSEWEKILSIHNVCIN